ncbi:MAG: hypothetical protein SPL96_05680, partial [Bacteroidales bacterium]|nr:hypothetical protein [Bacteroidales bacterium]
MCTPATTTPGRVFSCPAPPVQPRRVRVPVCRGSVAACARPCPRRLRVPVCRGSVAACARPCRPSRQGPRVPRLRRG